MTIAHVRECLIRDVTDHLQLLLRKSGHHLHTTAEKEIVRMISECRFFLSLIEADSVVCEFTEEKMCYVAISPAKEEKDAQGAKLEEYKLPDGQIIRVSIEIIVLEFSS